MSIITLYNNVLMWWTYTWLLGNVNRWWRPGNSDGSYVGEDLLRRSPWSLHKEIMLWIERRELSTRVCIRDRKIGREERREGKRERERVRETEEGWKGARERREKPWGGVCVMLDPFTSFGKDGTNQVAGMVI